MQIIYIVIHIDIDIKFSDQYRFLESHLKVFVIFVASFDIFAAS